jgi:hypothetical protein
VSSGLGGLPRDESDGILRSDASGL